jgi:hypothetical protein
MKHEEERAMRLPYATPSKATLLDLIQAVSDYATSDAEVVTTVAYLINSGRVLLCGNFAGAKIDLSPAACAVPLSSLSHTELARDAAFAAVH